MLTWLGHVQKRYRDRLLPKGRKIKGRQKKRGIKQFGNGFEKNAGQNSNKQKGVASDSAESAPRNCWTVNQVQYNSAG